MKPDQRAAHAGLAALIVLQGIMLGSLYAGVQPHPPATTPLFAIGPFLGASVATAVAAMIIGPLACSVGKVLAILAALAGLISFGPQKYFDAQFSLIWPAVVSGQVAALAVFLSVARSHRLSTNEASHLR